MKKTVLACLASVLMGSFAFSETTKELKVFILAGQSNMEGHGSVEMGRVPGDEEYKNQKDLIPNGVGSLRRFVNDNPEEYGAEGKTPLIDKSGKWLVRDDVYVYYPMQNKKGQLSTGFGIGTKIGPEFGFGHVIGNATQGPVLIIKTAWGGKDLAVDFRPPSSGETPLAKTRTTGAYYKEMLASVKKVMASVDAEFPALKGYTPRLAGFGWHQGWNDGCSDAMVSEYETNMCNFINDVRKDLGVKDLPFVVANTGQQGFGFKWSEGRRKDLCEIQLAVGDPEKHPEFKGTVASVETRNFCRLVGKSPSRQGYHWHQNGESYFLVGKGTADAMLKLMNGTGAAIFAATALPAAEVFAGWRQSGSLFILTTPEGANLPASAEVRDFPLLVRLHRDHFPFAEARADGGDVRFSADGKPLAHEIESWDAQAGTAAVWVRVPLLRGNERREVRIHWGKTDALDASDAKAVFNESNGYVGVWHLNGDAHEATSTLQSKDGGTLAADGVISGARRFSGNAGISCGKEIESLPTGGQAHSSQAWFRPDSANGVIVGWGNQNRAGKVVMSYRSPPRIRMDCYFSSGNVNAEIPGKSKGWTHVLHTHDGQRSALFINGVKVGDGAPNGGPMALERPARLWIGGWGDQYGFAGDIDEVRVSGVARSADWARLEYENQKPSQTLVGPVVRGGSRFSVAPVRVAMNEGDCTEITAAADGAQKVYWTMVEGGKESVIAVDRFRLPLDAGRVRADRSFTVRFDAVYADRVRSAEIPVTVRETLPEPRFSLVAPPSWDGRETIEIRPQIENLESLRKAGVGKFTYRWEVSGLATIHDQAEGKLVLVRSQGSGTLTVKLTLANGGHAVVGTVAIAVREPARDAWVHRVPDEHEMPADGQFYARDDSGNGTLHCAGKLEAPAEAVFLRVFADDRKFAEESRAPGADGSYAFAVKLAPGLVKYRIEFGTRTGGAETVRHRAGDILCGDAYLIEGQSNALATDTREESPRITHEWIRSYGQPQFLKPGESENLWCKPVWKANNPERTKYRGELGWWGMDLATRLVESQKVPVFFLNGAKGGTRIDQHQRNDADPTDLQTIYGRMLWRARQARITHGIRAVIWHQGESDQGTDGPDGGYGWETYQRYFVEMSADWKRDFPNLSRYYIYQIWPNACSMGGGHGDMLREVQRTLPGLYSNMEILSTLGIDPPGGCHFPLVGWSEFARMVQPLIERDFHGRTLAGPMTPPNLRQARLTGVARDMIALEFDQPVVWMNELVLDFLVNGEAGKISSGEVAGNVVTLKLAQPAEVATISYLRETNWDRTRLLVGTNGLASLTFCGVPVAKGAAPASR